MTEVQTGMTLEEFQQHHSQTWDYVARVGKIWERIAEEQQAIIDGKGYAHLGYASWAAYWDGEFRETSGWVHGTIERWLIARRIKMGTPDLADAALEPTVGQWGDLRRIPDPEQRAEFLARYDEFRPPRGTPTPMREAIKEFKGETTVREGLPIVRDVLSPEDMADLPDPELSPSERWVYETGKIVSALRRLTPEEVAEDTYRMMPDKLNWEVDAANQIIDWYEKYKQALHAQKNQGIRRVK